MKQYQDLLRTILEQGAYKSDRTGTGTYSIFGYQMRFDLTKGFPLLTTKKLHLRSIIYELLWFLQGDTNIKYIVPVMYEDYIFSFIVEEYGLIGAIIVIVLYISLLARGSLITRNCRDGYAKMAVAGLVILITAQAMMHIVINCDIGLLTGQTLPMISHGTSSFICFSIAFGIILSISRMTAKKIEKEGEKSAPLMDLSEKDEVQGAMDDLDYYESLDEFQEPDIDNENE